MRLHLLTLRNRRVGPRRGSGVRALQGRGRARPVLAILCSLALATACSGGGSGGGGSSHVTITWWDWISNPDKIIANFEKHHPNITVKHPTVGTGAALYSKLTTALAAGSGAPDVTQIEYPYLSQYIAKHQLADISKYVNKYKDDFPTWTWQQVSRRSAVYAVPVDIGPMGLIYRPDVLKKYHLPVPTTWDQFATDAVTLHKRDPSIWMTNAPVDATTLTSLFWQAGAQLFHGHSDGSWSITIDTPQTRKVVDYWANLIKQKAVPVVTNPQAVQKNTAKGVYATYIGAAWSPTYAINEYVKPHTQQFAVTRLPDWTAGQHTNANYGGSTNAVTTQSKHPKEAAEFAAFINTDRSALAIDEKPATAGGGGVFPADVHRAEVPVFSAPIPNFVTKDVNGKFSKYASEVNTGFEWSPWTTYFTTEFGQQLQSAINGKQSFDDALTKTQSALVKYATAAGFTVSTGG